MLKKFLVLVIVNVITVSIYCSESYYQTIKGKIIDQNTDYPLIGATVILVGSNPVIGTV